MIDSSPMNKNDHRIEEIFGAIQDIASGKFSTKIDISNAMDEIDGIATGINILAEEVQFRIEKQAEEIRTNLGKLASAFESFGADYTTLGSHIRKTSNKFDEGQTKLNKFSMHLNQIQSTQENEKQSASEENT